MSAERGADVARGNAVPAWHPLALVALLLAVSATGILLSLGHHELSHTRGGRLGDAYVPLLLVNWGLLLYVCRLGRPRSAFAELTGLSGYTTRRAVVDVGFALLAAAVIIAAESLWQSAFGTTRSAAVNAMLPTTPLERGVWCVVAASVGIAEEVVYRGYLAEELTRWASSRTAGILGQAALFALAHGEQGGGAMLRFFGYAVGLGALAHVRQSLMPGILAHVGIDLWAGFSS